MDYDSKSRRMNGHARPFTAHTVSSHSQLVNQHHQQQQQQQHLYNRHPHTATVIRVPPQKRQTRVSESDTESWGRISPNYLKYGTTRSLPANHQLPSSQHAFHAVSNHTAATHRHRPRILHAPFRRAQEEKESAVRHFEIELEQLAGYQYRPGENLAGKVCLDIRKNVEIRYVELVIVGLGQASLLQPQHGSHHTAKETYLFKRTYIIGTPDNRWTSVLTPGRYVSSFRFKLPRELPSSIQHEDSQGSGFSLSVQYYLKARVCDDVGNASISSRGSTNNVVKVLVSRKLPFTVLRSFDVNLVPGGLEPVSHQEDVLLSCLSGTAASVTLNLDRTVFLAGDDVRLEIEASLPSTQRVRELNCFLQQNVLFRETSERKTFILSQLCRKNPDSLTHDMVRERRNSAGVERSHNGSTHEPQYYEISMPTDINMIPSFLQGCKIVKVTYCLLVILKFTPAGGKLTFTIPLALGPAAEPIYTEKAGTRKALPVFNRPMRFPCFSPSAQRTKTIYSNRAQSSQSINVVTKYSNNVFSKCFLCCCSGNDDL